MPENTVPSFSLSDILKNGVPASGKLEWRQECNGHVVVEDHAYMGAGVVIKDGSNKPVVIGRGAVVGMGAVVTKSVPPGETVVGNPARPLVR
jgi:acetyltransferase-like isoleucine patch superfamily enzyme